MTLAPDQTDAPEAARPDLGSIFVSLELSRATWLVTSLSPGGGERMSRHAVRGGNVAGLLDRFADLEARALTAERVAHVNRIRGLLFAQGISDYEPIRRDRLETLRTVDGRPLRHQPTSALSVWFHRRVGEAGGSGKLILIVALARKLLVSLWRFAAAGIVPEGAVLIAA